MIRHFLACGLAGLVMVTAMPSVSSATLSPVSPSNSSVDLEQAEAYNNQGYDLASQGKFREAVAAFEQAIALYPSYDTAYNNLGITYAQMGNFSAAVSAFEQALTLNSGNVEYYNNLGSALGSLGRISEATNVFREAIARYPNDPDSHFNLAIALLNQNQFSEAVAALKTARDLYQIRNNLGAVQQITQILQDLEP
ncbi:tetratricopeptide repeat protein [Laspinema olomoucense]|uniref:Tetratricopeptide repeat protein n=1 Tax=Laspinema olomoucense D3b TaxID=2953688 RepID=A0ABT2NF61_9CYAN|nr:MULTISPECIES: tetratricopeptide repeat protein [unclassified Laspinema]MCT7972123.1 tetratricopeptide repeat protein [Laspinema sp. D3d]MCT7981318.1 tetratricopeptide repeat protein [Laspinema sp. D3b]MCT7990906.1 tetratricopeptide repeat protein [Laspinema sp. D3a]